MKNLIIYYFQIIMPIPLMYLCAKNGYTTLFVFLLGFYYIYRIFTDYNRLLKKKIVSKNDFYLFFIPLWTVKYFNELYFEK